MNHICVLSTDYDLNNGFGFSNKHQKGDLFIYPSNLNHLKSALKSCDIPVLNKNIQFVCNILNYCSKTCFDCGLKTSGKKKLRIGRSEGIATSFLKRDTNVMMKCLVGIAFKIDETNHFQCFLDSIASIRIPEKEGYCVLQYPHEQKNVLLEKEEILTIIFRDLVSEDSISIESHFDGKVLVVGYLMYSGFRCEETHTQFIFIISENQIQVPGHIQLRETNRDRCYFQVRMGGCTSKIPKIFNTKLIPVKNTLHLPQNKHFSDFFEKAKLNDATESLSISSDSSDSTEINVFNHKNDDDANNIDMFLDKITSTYYMNDEEYGWFDKHKKLNFHELCLSDLATNLPDFIKDCLVRIRINFQNEISVLSRP